MKILFYNHTGTVSGAERVLMMILGRLNRDRYEPVVVCPENSRLMEMIRAAGVRTRGLQALEARFTWRVDRMIRYLLSFAAVIRCARNVVKDEAPDAIHANSIRAGLVMSAATLGLRVPVIWHAHDILPRHPLSTAIRLFTCTTSQNRILAVSHAVADRFRGVVLRPLTHRVPITVIHNAVDLDRFQPDENAGQEIRSELDLSATQPVVGIVGQLTPRKGQLELIEAFSQVAREIPDSLLLIIGEPLFNREQEYAKKLKQVAQALGISDRVCFLGNRDDVPKVMQGLDVLVVNSHQEPFALTVLEGLASGTAVLATAVGGTPEMVRHRENGYLVSSRDHAELSNAILALLRDKNLRRQLGRKGRFDAVAKFSIDRFIKDVESLYRGVLATRKMPQHENAAALKSS
ncbi:MAG TPA: glycosyltransferase family 4 protein [Pyrinomonadaceae bacterium]|nr:glycosyltransferase family 4 protein [Pyrinomonadaceae bacterium]